MSRRHGGRSLLLVVAPFWDAYSFQQDGDFMKMDDKNRRPVPPHDPPSKGASPRRAIPAALLLLLVAGCTSGLKRPVVSVEAVTDAAGVQRVEVDLHSFYFRPNRIVVHAGRPVELILRNRAIVVPHSFTVADSSLSLNLGAWGPGAHHLRFTPRTPGEYPFFCRVDGHANKGMRGTLVVLP